jgi:hypothetical protein
MSKIAPFILLVTAIFSTAPADRADACTCVGNPGIEHRYAEAENVVRVKVRHEVTRVHRMAGVPTLDGTIQVYRAVVKEVYKGCLQRGQTVKLFTAKDGGACGVDLDERESYVVALGPGEDRAFAIHLCGFIRPIDTLTPAEVHFLNTRFSCCGDECECVRTTEVACPVDPCDVESCGDATCVPNFCGRCKAEFFDLLGQPVCTGCSDDRNCSFGQVCEAGQCMPRSECEDDGDCATNRWCRPTENGGSACVPFVGQGAACDFFAPPWLAERCAANLVCVPIDPQIPDQGGTCNPPA